MPDSAEEVVEDVGVRCFEIPTDRPESDGTLQWSSTTVIVAQVRGGGQTGLGYSYGHRAAATLIAETLTEVVRGQDVVDTQRSWDAMVAAVRNAGRPGVASCAISAVDNALWDLKARLFGVSMVELVGGARRFIEAYASGGFTSYTLAELQRQLAGWREEGFDMCKIKVGREPSSDPSRVAAARRVIGEAAELFVDANGAYDRRQAIEAAERFGEHRVTWFEEPVSSDDRAGLKLVRDRAPAAMAIAAGEYGFDAMYFRDLLAAEAVDVVQADATRCLGTTGFLQVAALCFAHCIPLSAHCAPHIHAHLCCGVPAAVHVEAFHDHRRIEHELFAGALEANAGVLSPDRTRLGWGLELKERDARAHAV